MDISEIYMARCIELAKLGRGNAAPNPMVGAVIVCDGRIIGEGYHRCCGEAHAEVNAIASVADELLLRNSTLYVSLEPCSHHGKTPPCAELIIKKGIPRVVVACHDPYPEVSGRGIKMLREAGVEVVSGIMEKEAIELNRYFMTAHREQRPYIILKWAQSADGFIDRARKSVMEEPALLSTTVTRMMVHKLRSEVQAIMVGTNTAILDNPSLTVRHWVGRSPVRILIDRNLRVPQDFHLFDETKQTIIYTKEHISESSRYEKRAKKNIEYVKMDDSIHFFRNMLADMYKKNIHSLLIEGGACVHRYFMDEGLWDEIIIETAPVYLKDGVKAPVVTAANNAKLVDKHNAPKFETPNLKPSKIEWYINGEVLKK